MSDENKIRRNHDWAIPCCMGCAVYGHVRGCTCTPPEKKSPAKVLVLRAVRGSSSPKETPNQ